MLKVLKNISFIVLIITPVIAQSKIEFVGKLVKSPVATTQLGPSIFFSENNFKSFKLIEGTPIRVHFKNHQIDLRPYIFFGADDEFALHPENSKRLGLEEGTSKIFIEKISSDQTELTSKPIKFYVENYKGDLNKWKGFAFEAPHGDCDNETGLIVKLLTEKYGIPSTAAYGCRLSYRGIWFDCNRPLMQEPKENQRGILPERKWNKSAEEKYLEFQDSILANSEMKYGDRFKLYCSFHGHDLAVKLNSGKVIERPVIEGMGMGFSDYELRRIKNYYNRVKFDYYSVPPDLYFGNLPEDSVYYFDGVKLRFFYTGLGARTYGSLRRDFLENGLHFETPNSMRIPVEVQEKTADLLAEIFSFVKDSIFSERNNAPQLQIDKDIYSPQDFGKRLKIPAGEFIFGTDDEQSWSSEKPAHRVYLDEFYIDKYEVTNIQFVDFLNELFNQRKIIVEDGIVYNSDKSKKHYSSNEGNPFAEISFDGEKFSVDKKRNNFPVVFVTYWGVEEYAKFNGGRIPTEAEWEKAASWNDIRKIKSFYSTGTNSINPAQANYEQSVDPFENNLPATTPVGYYSSASFYGVKDMSGNVWEWTSDNFISSVYSTRKTEVIKNPKVEAESTMKTTKGGAWDTEYSVLRSSIRLGINPDYGLINLGFRCVYNDNNK
jgi:formylglycine-generating enzyme required for sulfatase activity